MCQGSTSTRCAVGRSVTRFMLTDPGVLRLSGKRVKHFGSTSSNIIEGKVMMEYRVKRPLKRAPIHPGEVLREDVLPELKLTVSEAARRLGVSRQQLHRILGCTHPITVEMALRIGRLAGNGPGLWLRMQQNHDLWYAEQELRDELNMIQPGAGA